MNTLKGKHSRGFTIIEVMIALAIFTVIVTIGIGAVLDSITQHKTTENARTVMDNLNFVMEDMARNIRLGTSIHCELPSDGSYVDASTGEITPGSCPSPTDAHNKIVFRDLTGKNNITYTISAPTDEPSKIYKQKDDLSSGSLVLGTPVSITPPDIIIDFDKSGFTVRGAEPDDGMQPTVVIRLSGTIQYKDIDTRFSLQTTVVQRSLDS